VSEPDSIPPPFTAGARAFDYEYADDFRDFGPAELTEAEEDYRSRAYEAALHYARDYGLSLIPVWWMADKMTCARRDDESCVSQGKYQELNQVHWNPPPPGQPPSHAPPPA
jgi:hypothetical protein